MDNSHKPIFRKLEYAILEITLWAARMPIVIATYLFFLINIEMKRKVIAWEIAGDLTGKVTNNLCILLNC